MRRTRPGMPKLLKRVLDWIHDIMEWCDIVLCQIAIKVQHILDHWRNIMRQLEIIIPGFRRLREFLKSRWSKGLWLVALVELIKKYWSSTQGPPNPLWEILKELLRALVDFIQKLPTRWVF